MDTSEISFLISFFSFTPEVREWYRHTGQQMNRWQSVTYIMGTREVADPLDFKSGGYF